MGEPLSRCLYCDAEEQSGRYCSECGRALEVTDPASAPSPIASDSDGDGGPSIQPAELARSSRGRLKWAAAAIAVVAAGVVLGSVILSTGRNASKATASSHTLTGSLAVVDPTTVDDGFTQGGPCYTGGGYSDIRTSTEVVVYDGADRVIATGALESGIAAAPLFGDSVIECDFNFTVNHVPDASYYKVEVSHRGGLTYSRSDLSSKGWHVDISLGQ